jgi:DNA-binding response OmpR family regulator
MEEKKIILLVDDDPDILEQTKLLLETRNYKVITAESGEEGYKLFKEGNPDAAVVDLIMEEHDSGFILSYNIKKVKNIPVFILTSATTLTGYKFGSTTEEEKEWIKCDEILNKPVRIEELIQKLEHYFVYEN